MMLKATEYPNAFTQQALPPAQLCSGNRDDSNHYHDKRGFTHQAPPGAA